MRRAAKHGPRSKATRAAGARLPLAALRARLDAEGSDAIWSLNPDGLLGRSLIVPAGDTVTVPLRLAAAVTFSARVMLLSHDWRDGRGALRVSVSVTESASRRHELWSRSLRSAASRGAPRGHRIECSLPASTIAVHLTVHSGFREHRAVARAVWLEPAIIDPQVPPVLDAADGEPPSSERQPPVPFHGPLISVLTPVHDPPLQMLEEAIESVRCQTFSNWELCLVDDGSTNPEIIAALERHAASDPRIHLERRDQAGGISTATNAALELASGQYIALLDHDDTLTPDALEHVARQIASKPELDMIYSDEDIVLDGRRVWAHFKPAWSPDTLRTNGYTCHLGAYRRKLLSELGGFRTEFNGSQDVDMILRLVERTDRIAHIPRILYHWRAHADSTAGGDAKPYAYVAARNAIAAHLVRTGQQADVSYGPPGLYRVVHRVSPSTTVDLVLAVDSEQGLSDAAASWSSQPHPTWNVVIAAPSSTLPAVTGALLAAGVPEARVTAVPVGPDQHLASALAAAADAATAEVLLLMQTPGIGLTHDWLSRLVGYSQQPHIAAAGPIILAPDGRIQQAGVAVPNGIPLHLLHGVRSSMDNFFGYGTSVYNVSAVSGVLAARRRTYRKLGGLRPEFNELALIEYCLRARSAHQRIVIVPDARLRTTGRAYVTNDLPAIWRLREVWTQTHTHDPYYNANYRTDCGDFEPRQAS